MNELIILKIIFTTMPLVGSVVLFLIAFKGYYKYLLQEKRCTSCVKGEVKKYTFFARGGKSSPVFLPIVFYEVDGKNYKVIGPEYRYYKHIRLITPTAKNTIEFNEQDQVYRDIAWRNSLGTYFSNTMEDLFPIGRELDVYYDPTNPSLAYVLRYCNKKNFFWLLFGCGLLCVAIGLATFFLL